MVIFTCGGCWDGRSGRFGRGKCSGTFKAGMMRRAMNYSVSGILPAELQIQVPGQSMQN